jgi:fatty-acyl-CoA synthase
MNITAKLKLSSAKLCVTFLLYAYAAFTSTIAVLFHPNATIVFPSYKLNLVDILEAVQTYRCNVISALPKIFHNILTHSKRNDYDLSSLSMVQIGGQSITSELINLARQETNIKFAFVGYGSTETNSLISNIINLESFDPDKYQGCMGKPGAYVECKIVDPETGKIQPLGSEGELHFRSFSQSRGYWNDEAKTREVFDKNGW